MLSQYYILKIRDFTKGKNYICTVHYSRLQKFTAVKIVIRILTHGGATLHVNVVFLKDIFAIWEKTGSSFLQVTVTT